MEILRKVFSHVVCVLGIVILVVFAALAIWMLEHELEARHMGPEWLPETLNFTAWFLCILDMVLAMGSSLILLVKFLIWLWKKED